MMVRELVATLGLDFASEGWEKAEHAFESLHHKATALGAVLAGSFAALTGITLEVTEQADHIGILAQQLGIGAEEFQQMAYAANMGDVGLEDFGNSLKFLQRSAAEASKGTEQYAEAFTELGISVKDAATGKIKPAKDLFYEVAERMKSVREPARRVQIAMDMMGRSGAQMVPVLLKGREGLKEFAKEATDSGYVMSKEFIERFGELDESFKRTRGLLRGLMFTMAEHFLPVIERVVKGFTRWYNDNKKVIALITGWGVRAIASTITAIGFVVRGLGELLTWLGSVNPMLATTAIAVFALAAAFASPAIAIGLLIAGVLLLVDDLKTLAEGGDSTVGKLLDAFGKLLGLEDLSGTVRDFFSWLMQGGIGDALYDAFEKVKEVVDDVISGLKWLKGNAAAAFNMLTGDVTGAASDAAGAVGGAVGAVANAIGVGSPSSATASPAMSGDGSLSYRSRSASVQQVNHVTINASGADAHKVKELFDQHNEEQLQATHAALTGGVDDGG